MSERSANVTVETDIIDCLACPFCGIDDMTIMEMSCERGDGWKVICENCGGEGPFNEDKLAAQHAWNRRI